MGDYDMQFSSPNQDGGLRISDVSCRNEPMGLTGFDCFRLPEALMAIAILGLR